MATTYDPECSTYFRLAEFLERYRQYNMRCEMQWTSEDELFVMFAWTINGDPRVLERRIWPKSGTEVGLIEMMNKVTLGITTDPRKPQTPPSKWERGEHDQGRVGEYGTEN